MRTLSVHFDPATQCLQGCKGKGKEIPEVEGVKIPKTWLYNAESTFNFRAAPEGHNAKVDVVVARAFA